MTHTAKIRPPLLPDSVKRPLVLLWVAALPQLVLLLINLRAFWLASGEMVAWQKAMAARIFGFEILLFLVPAALALVLRARRQLLPWSLNIALLLAPIFYLWLVMSQIMGGHFIPTSVAAWILPPEQLLYYQFIFTMPLIFYAGIRLACIDLKVSPGFEISVSTAVIIGVPLAWLALFQILSAGEWFFSGHKVAFAVFMGLGICSTILVLLAAARACVTAYVATRRKGPIALAILSFLVGIAGPLGGLWLNKTVEFPADFQTWPIYAMALANGCILLLPNFRHTLLHRLVWLAQCALFPFTLYFFLVFLPFLPLSIFAMLAAGAGFLILTPTALFLVHGQRILDGYRNEIRDGRPFTPALLGALALAILPGIFVAQACIDRVVLRGAIEYVYNPDYRQPDYFKGSRAAVRRSLERLRDSKAGVYLPFLSDFYSWAVFDNLVLPDEKMNAIHRAFFGRDLAPAQAQISLFGGQPRRGMLTEAAPNVALPPSDVVLSELTATSAREGDCERTTLTLKMQNQSASQSEFVSQIKIPEGVFISGFWLSIGDERVPGRLFEKKTALWVYQKIRDQSRRDPGILVYSDPSSVDLRVFPFAAHELRKVEIELLYPAALQPSLTMSGRTWSAAPAASGVCLVQADIDSSAVALPPEALIALPPAPRTPYLHFIVDHSASAGWLNDETIGAMQSTAAHFPEAQECAITLANYESADITTSPVPIVSLTAKMLHSSALPARGGFLPERAMKRALLAYRDQLSRGGVATSRWAQNFPVFVIIGGKRDALSFSNDLVQFGRLAPDAAAFYVTENGTSLTAYDFTGKAGGTGVVASHPVALLKVGQAVAPCRLDAVTAQLIHFASADAPSSLSVLDQGAFRPIAETVIIPPEAAYGRGVRALQRYLDWIYNPSLGNTGLAGVVKTSRDTGILLAATSYIVVENTAQWKMLELKERQKLGNLAALEFEQTPEPTTALLVVLGGGSMLLARRRRRHPESTSS